MRQLRFAPRRGAAMAAVSLIGLSACVVPAAGPGIVEPGAAVRAVLAPPAPVSVLPDGPAVTVRFLTGEVESIDSAGYVIRVTRAEEGDGDRASAIQGRRVRLLRADHPDIRIFSADARASHAMTFGVVGVVVGVISTALLLLCAGGD